MHKNILQGEHLPLFGIPFSPQNLYHHKFFFKISCIPVAKMQSKDEVSALQFYPVNDLDEPTITDYFGPKIENLSQGRLAQ